MYASQPRCRDLAAPAVTAAALKKKQFGISNTRVLHVASAGLKCAAEGQNFIINFLRNINESYHSFGEDVVRKKFLGTEVLWWERRQAMPHLTGITCL